MSSNRLQHQERDPATRPLNPTSDHGHYPPRENISTRAIEAGSEQDSDDDADFDLEMSLAHGALNGKRNGDRDRGLGRSASHPFRALTPKRIALAAGVILVVLFWFGNGSDKVTKAVHKVKEESSTDLVPVAPDAEEVVVSKLPPSSPQKQGSAGSRKCTPPPGQKATTYALMIDAGSTGSRLHVYTFSHCDSTPGALPKLEDEGFYTTKPGLSSYKGKPREAAESLRELMDNAMTIPKAERSCTPIAVKATAGLRLLGASESNAILKEVERWLNDEYPFNVVEDGVVIMDGRDEGERGQAPHSTTPAHAILTYRILRCLRMDHDQLAPRYDWSRAECSLWHCRHHGSRWCFDSDCVRTCIRSVV